MRLRTLVTLVALAIAAFTQTPVVTDNMVLNAASFDRTHPISVGSLVSIFGTDLAGSLAVGSSIPLSNALGDVSVTFNGIPAPLLFVSQGQINAQLPWNVLAGGATSGTASVVVKRGNTSSQPKNVTVGSVSPGIFSVNFGVGNAIAINLDGTLAAPAGSLPPLTTHPARPGDTVIILATGLGAVDGPIENGVNSGATLRNTVNRPTVVVGGRDVQPAFSGLAPEFVGVNQLNVVIPADAPVGDAVPLQLRMGSAISTDKVTIAIQR